MSRRCSHCGHNGHNSRTCPDRGIRLFGVRLTDAANSSSNNSNSSSIAIRKSVSVGNLSSALQQQQQQQQQQNSATPEHSESGDGYVSDGLVQSSGNTRERKKGVPWTEDEHRMFLLGLHKLGKGDWRGIARNYVTSRTPTQVASHAQKYFIRQGNLSKRKRRSSLFDISTEAQCMVLDETFCTESSGFLAHSSLLRPPLAPESSPDPVQFQKSVEDDSALWLGISSPPPPPPPTVTGATLVKPTAVVKSSGIRIEDPHSELTKLSLGPNFSSSSSLRLEQPSSRHSAFHANPNASNTSSALNKPISVV